MREDRPWGYFEVLFEDQTVKVKKLWIKPDCRISLQSHKHRTEYWTVASGTGALELNGNVFLMNESSVWTIKPGDIHRAKAVNDLGLTIIEVQVGSYTGEDDIIRYEDDFNRV